MQDAKIKLQDAFNRGFVPKDLKKAMDKRGHQGQVWIVENENEPRLGVGYRMENEDGTFSDQVHWYEPKEVSKLLKEAK